MTLEERVDAVITSTELMSGLLQDVLANVDQLRTANDQPGTSLRLTATMERLSLTMEKMIGHMDTLAQMVVMLEDRLKRLENSRQ